MTVQKIFKVVTKSTCITEYLVKASSIEEANEIFYEGHFESSNDIDFQDEEIISTKLTDVEIKKDN